MFLQISMALPVKILKLILNFNVGPSCLHIGVLHNVPKWEHSTYCAHCSQMGISTVFLLLYKIIIKFDKNDNDTVINIMFQY